MDDSLKDSLVQLSITSLMDCLSEINKKEKFIKEIPTEEHSKIVKFMRQESSVIALRDFHNWIKLVLITNIRKLVPKKKVNLLDVSVGRGGDLIKWNKAGITSVFGFDSSVDSINGRDPENPGAKMRLKNLKGYGVDVEFHVGDATRPLGDVRTDTPEVVSKINNFLEKRKIKGFDIVSCQFALHYFFISEIALKNALTLISKSLLPGGYFVGTTIDSENIKNYFEYLPPEIKVFKKNLYRIEKFFSDKIKSPYGNKYTFTIYDIFDKTNYFNTTGTSTEYLVSFQTLNKLANEVGLEPVFLNLFEPYDNGFTSTQSNVITFREIYELGKWKPKSGTRQITPEELELSFLNSVFVFRKKQ